MNSIIAIEERHSEDVKHCGEGGHGGGLNCLFKDFTTPKMKTIQMDVFRHLNDAQQAFTVGFEFAMAVD